MVYPRAYLSGVSLALAFLAVLPLEARADLYGFTRITNNSAANATVAGQFAVEVTDAGADQVLFRFSNSGPLDSSITRVYFDDGVLDSIAGLFDAENGGSPGVNFSEGASPGNLPAGNSIVPPFDATVTLSASSDPPVQPNGVNPGEWLGVLFNLQDGKGFADVINAMDLGVSDPGSSDSLRVGIHVQGFADGSSESFVHVPAPAALLLGMLGLSAAGVRLRKFV